MCSHTGYLKTQGAAQCCPELGDCSLSYPANQLIIKTRHGAAPGSGTQLPPIPWKVCCAAQHWGVGSLILDCISAWDCNSGLPKYQKDERVLWELQYWGPDLNTMPLMGPKCLRNPGLRTRSPCASRCMMESEGFYPRSQRSHVLPCISGRGSRIKFFRSYCVIKLTCARALSC